MGRRQSRPGPPPPEMRNPAGRLGPPGYKAIEWRHFSTRGPMQGQEPFPGGKIYKKRARRARSPQTLKEKVGIELARGSRAGLRCTPRTWAEAGRDAMRFDTVIKNGTIVT